MDVIQACRELAAFSEQPGRLTRTFLSAPMRDAHRRVGEWMSRAGMLVSVDAIGNLRGYYEGRDPAAPRLLIGSHLDTVPNAGAFDGQLGVVMGIALVERLAGRRLDFGIEVIGFSEEEGVRFGAPFLGSLALAGEFDYALLDRRDASGCTMAGVIRGFGLDPARIPEAEMREPALGYIEFHIEQGPVLDSLGAPLGVVTGIAGQTRAEIEFTGSANHAGTTPMSLRRDALAGAAEWILSVEKSARAVEGLVATVGRIEAAPGATNVIAGGARLSLDARHADDEIRRRAAAGMLREAEEIARRRGLTVERRSRLDQPGVACNPGLARRLADAVEKAGYTAHSIVSGAGHDAMIVARKFPSAMLFLRTPGGISHHPDETALPGDVEAALAAGMALLEGMET
jgi:allantoate deiminase